MNRQKILRVPCPTCDAPRNEPCRKRNGEPAATPHADRQFSAMRKAGQWEPTPKNQR